MSVPSAIVRWRPVMSVATESELSPVLTLIDAEACWKLRLGTSTNVAVPSWFDEPDAYEDFALRQTEYEIDTPLTRSPVTSAATPVTIEDLTLGEARMPLASKPVDPVPVATIVEWRIVVVLSRPRPG